MVVAVLVVVDVALVGAYLIHRFGDGALAHAIWDSDGEGSLMELAERVQLGVAATTFAVLWWRLRERVHAVLAVTIALILLDHVTRFHELGGAMARGLVAGPVLGVEPQRLGELVVWSTLGLAALAALVLAQRSAGAGTRRLVLAALLPLSGLVIFAIGVDTVGSVLPGPARRTATVVENIGELMSIGLLAVVVLVGVALTPRRDATAR